MSFEICLQNPNCRDTVEYIALARKENRGILRLTSRFEGGNGLYQDITLT